MTMEQDFVVKLLGKVESELFLLTNRFTDVEELFVEVNTPACLCVPCGVCLPGALGWTFACPQASVTRAKMEAFQNTPAPHRGNCKPSKLWCEEIAFVLFCSRDTFGAILF